MIRHGIDATGMLWLSRYLKHMWKHAQSLVKDGVKIGMHVQSVQPKEFVESI